jgi:AraC family ethanolamine operon transcriptional activator
MAALLPGWQLELQQLGKGRFRGDLFMAHTSQLAVAEAAWEPGILVRGDIPAGTGMLAMPLRCGRPASHCRWQIPENRMPLRFSGEGVDFHTTCPMEMFVVTADARLLERHAAILLGCSLKQVRKHREVAIESAGHKQRQLQGLMSCVQAALRHDSAQLRVSALARQFEGTILEIMLSGIYAPQPELTRCRRRELAYETEQVIRDGMDGPLSIFDLCRAMQVPERTLHLAFKEHFGTTPKAYLKMLRLNAARQDLRRSRGHTTVTEVAIRRGFGHLSWFAHDYREMFGETPVQTLLRERQRSCPPDTRSVAVLG